MIKKIQKKYALSHKGAVDLLKGILACTLQNIVFMLPVGLLYLLVDDLLKGSISQSHIVFYIVGTVVALLLIALSFFYPFLQHFSTF